MPMYEYVCEQCEAHTEALQKFNDAPLTTCEDCGGALYRPISRSSFALKGGGWYADGYSDSKPAKKDSGSGTSKSTEKKSTEKKTTSSD